MAIYIEQNNYKLLCRYSKYNKYNIYRMKIFALTVLIAVSVSGFSSNRNGCPTLQDAANAFESHFGTQARTLNALFI